MVPSPVPIPPQRSAEFTVRAVRRLRGHGRMNLEMPQLMQFVIAGRDIVLINLNRTSIGVQLVELPHTGQERLKIFLILLTSKQPAIDAA